MEIETKPLARVLETAAKFGGVAKFRRKHGFAAAEVVAPEIGRPSLAMEKKGKPKSKSLYLCFSELIEGYGVKKRNYVGLSVESIKLNLSDDGGYTFVSNSKLGLRRVGYHVWKMGRGFYSVGCTVFGNPPRIVFSGTTNMMTSHERNRIWVFKVNKAPKPKSKSMLISVSSHVKNYPLLVELQGKLYALATYLSDNLDDNHLFEVLNPTEQIWESLPNPPDPCFPYPSRPDSSYPSRFSIAITGDKILYSSPNVQGVHYFDIQTKEWKPLSLGNRTDLPFKPGAFVHQLENDGGYLMFNYNALECLDEPDNTISVFLMSHQFESLNTLNPVKLPSLPPEFTYNIFNQWSFAHLGRGRKFCFVLNGFYSNVSLALDDGIVLEESSRIHMGVLLIITFEYDVMITKSKTESKYKILNTHRIEYKPPEHKDGQVTSDYELHGAFVLNNMEDEDTDAEYE